MGENIWNNRRFRFSENKKSKNKLFNGVDVSHREFNIREQDIVEGFVNRHKCDFVVINNLECQLIRYFTEESEEDDKFFVHRAVSKIIMN